MSAGTRHRFSTALALAVVILVAGSCARVVPPDESSAERSDVSVTGDVPDTAVGPPAADDSLVGGVRPSEAESNGGDPAGPVRTVPVRTGDTLSELGEQVSGPTPTGIEIDGLDIVAPVTPSGIDADGAFDLPPGSEAGWYRFGPAPGAQGSAVLAAHVDWNGVPGVFFDLAKAEVGERITIRYDDGSRLEFEITSLTQFVKTQLPLDELFEREGPPRLVLITCGGAFDPVARSYADNVVVIARVVTS